MEKFYLDDYLKSRTNEADHRGLDFQKLCRRVNTEFLREWDDGKENLDSALRIQKKAIIGYENEVSYFKSRIRQFIKKYGAEHSSYPGWYESLEDAIYQENWGLAGVSEWFSEKFMESSSAKIIGDRIFFLEEGQMSLKPQTISKDRREQMIRAFLLLTPEERLDKEFHEVYMLDGTRVTIFGGGMTNISAESGTNVTLALEDIQIQLREARLLFEERKRLNSESARMVVFLAPVMYLGTIVLSINYLGIPFGKFIRNQFYTEQGFLLMLLIIFLFLINLALIEIINNQRFDY